MGTGIPHGTEIPKGMGIDFELSENESHNTGILIFDVPEKSLKDEQ